MRYFLADSGVLMLEEKAGLVSMSSFMQPVVREAYDAVCFLVAAPLLAGGGCQVAGSSGSLAALYYSLRHR